MVHRVVFDTKKLNVDILAVEKEKIKEHLLLYN